MGDNSKIAWTDATWNPVSGCSHVSEGCRHCFAERWSHRYGWTSKPWTAPNAPENVKFHPDRLDMPLRWHRPRRIFVNSMSDLFHPQIPFGCVAQVFAVMALCPQHQFQVLTKRGERMLDFFLDYAPGGRNVWTAGQAINMPRSQPKPAPGWPLPNVWLGVSVEHQEAANERLPPLLQAPAAVRWISAEPLLGPVDLRAFLPRMMALSEIPGSALNDGASEMKTRGLDWVVVGGESGPHARPMHPDWARGLRDQCQSAGVAFHFKQWGEWIENYHRTDITGKYRPGFCFVSDNGGTSFPAPIKPDPDREGFNPFDPILRGHPGWACMKKVGKKAAGNILDGRTWDEYPVSSEAPFKPFA